MRNPSVGDRAACEFCGRPIEFKGEYWSHRVDGSPKFRHIARPKEYDDETRQEGQGPDTAADDAD